MKKPADFKKIVSNLIASIILLLPTYLIRFKISNIPTTFLEVYIYFIFFLFLIERIKSREKIASIRFILPILLFVLSITSSFYANEKAVSLGQAKAYFFDGLLVLIMFYFYRNYNEFKQKIFSHYLLSGLVVSLWGILQRIGLIGLIPHQKTDPLLSTQLAQGRILGPFESPNYLAMYILPIMIMLLVNFLSKKKFLEIKYFKWLFGIFFVTLVLTQSISSFIGLIVACCFYYFFKDRKKYLYVILSFIIIASSIFFLGKYSSKLNSVTSRLEIYKAAIQIGERHSLLGIGLGNFPKYFVGLPIENRLNWEALHPHNIFLSFWVHMGWPGLIAFSALIIICLRKKNITKEPVFYFALVAILANGLTDTTFFKNDLSIIFWYIIAYLI